MNRILLSTAAVALFAAPTATFAQLSEPAPATPDTAIEVQTRSNAISDEDVNAPTTNLVEDATLCPEGEGIVGVDCVPGEDVNEAAAPAVPDSAIDVQQRSNVVSDDDAEPTVFDGLAAEMPEPGAEAVQSTGAVTAPADPLVPNSAIDVQIERNLRADDDAEPTPFAE